MNHAGITSGCASCHASGKSFFGVTVVTPPATHIPTGGAACESCHSTTTFTNFGGTAINHAAVSGLPCATCHEAGKSWYGVTIVTRPTLAQDPNHPQTGECGTCHTSTVSFMTGITTMPSNHIPTTQPCALCHTTPGNYAVATMNHQGINSGCATCHASGLSFANVTPVSPPPTHIPTAQPCEVCHSPTKFTNFRGTAMNHAGINSGCANCHGAGKSFFGVTIVTPPATHLRRHHRHTAHARAGPESPANRRMRDLPHLDGVVHQRDHDDAVEPHSDDPALRAVSHDARQFRRRDDESPGHHQRLCDVRRRGRDRRHVGK